MEKIKPTYYVRKKATNYQKYRKILSAKLRTYVLRVNTIEELDESAETLTNSIMDSFNQCKVERKCKEIVRLPYLTQVHMNKSADLKKQFKRAYKPSNSNKNLRLKYRKDLNEHMKSIRRARNNSWRKFTSEIKNTKEAARLQKFFEGYSANDADETHAELLRAKFPECTVLDIDDEWPENILNFDPLDDFQIMEINECTTKDKILRAISEFDPYKCAGGDGIFPALLQKGSDILVLPLQTLIRASLWLCSKDMEKHPSYIHSKGWERKLWSHWLTKSNMSNFLYTKNGWETSGQKNQANWP